MHRQLHGGQPMIQCSQCGTGNPLDAKFCTKCGRIVFASPLTNRAAGLRLDCNACRASQSMEATKIPKFTPILRVIGAIIVCPSVLGLVFAAFIFITMMVASGSVV